MKKLSVPQKRKILERAENDIHSIRKSHPQIYFATPKIFENQKDPEELNFEHE